MTVDTSSPRSRRAILMGALGAAAASVAAVIGRASPVSAATGDVVVLVGHSYDANGPTAFYTTESGAVIGSSDKNSGVYGFSGSGEGVFGMSTSSLGVLGRSTATDQPAIRGESFSGSTGVQGSSGSGGLPPTVARTGVHGYGSDPNGIGVYGQTTDTTSETYGVHGRVAGSLGRGVFGWGKNETSGGTGVWGQSSSGTGVGVRGYAWDGHGVSGKFGTGVLGSSGSHAFPPPASRANTGVMGVAPGGTGIYGTGARGGVFRGSYAQIKLAPSSAASHPPRGAKGDLFVDASTRFWFCKGGTTWTQIA